MHALSTRFQFLTVFTQFRMAEMVFRPLAGVACSRALTSSSTCHIMVSSWCSMAVFSDFRCCNSRVKIEDASRWRRLKQKYTNILFVRQIPLSHWYFAVFSRPFVCSSDFMRIFTVLEKPAVVLVTMAPGRPETTFLSVSAASVCGGLLTYLVYLSPFISFWTISLWPKTALWGCYGVSTCVCIKTRPEKMHPCVKPRRLSHHTCFCGMQFCR